MATKEQILNYVMKTPYNTNRIILSQMLDSFGASGTEKYAMGFAGDYHGFKFDNNKTFQYVESLPAGTIPEYDPLKSLDGIPKADNEVYIYDISPDSKHFVDTIELAPLTEDTYVSVIDSAPVGYGFIHFKEHDSVDSGDIGTIYGYNYKDRYFFENIKHYVESANPKKTLVGWTTTLGDDTPISLPDTVTEDITFYPIFSN